MTRRPQRARGWAGCVPALLLLASRCMPVLLALGGMPAPLAGAESEDGAPPVALSMQPAERNRLIEVYNRWAAGIQTLRAGGKARVGAEGEKTRAFQFSLLVARPGNARVQGRLGSLATLFDLSGSPEEWTLYLPQERTVVRNRDGEGGAGLLLPPREILAVLLPAGIPPRDLDRGGTASLDSGLARLVVPPGKGGAGSAFHRVLWLDPREGTPRRLEVRRESQLETPMLIAVYERFEGKGASALPGEITVEMPETSQWARFTFETTRVNGDVSPGAFHIQVPAGTRNIAPEELSPDFLPEAEEAP